MKNFFVTALLLTGLVAGSANAAVISGSLDASPSDAEVFNTDIIGAISVGTVEAGVSQAIAVTVNGVGFAPAGVSEAGDTPFNNTIGNASVGQLNVTSTGNADGFSGFNASSEPGSIDTLLDSIIITTGSAFTFAFSDLQPLTNYTLQVFLASGTQGNREVEFLQGATSLVTWDNGANSESAAIFTFTTGAGTPGPETLTLRNFAGGTIGNDDPIMSGYLFAGTAIPEPSSICLVALGLLGMTGFGRRRK